MMAIEECWLTNQTGAIIRFRPTQLPRLPKDDTHVEIELFNGRVIEGKFHGNPANPYIAGKELRRFIRRRVDVQSREHALIDVTGQHWRLFEVNSVIQEAKRHRVSSKRLAEGKMGNSDLRRMLGRIDKLNAFKGRKREYQRLLSPPGLRQMMLDTLGDSCQVVNCTSVEDAIRECQDPAAGRSIVEVHHIEAMSKCEDHHPRNLCVLCANHHRLIHGLGQWSIFHHGDDVTLQRRQIDLIIKRDLTFLQ